jgi:uncharacterized membrane protein YgcG
MNISNDVFSQIAGDGTFQCTMLGLFTAFIIAQVVYLTCSVMDRDALCTNCANECSQYIRDTRFSYDESDSYPDTVPNNSLNSSSNSGCVGKSSGSGSSNSNSNGDSNSSGSSNSNDSSSSNGRSDIGLNDPCYAFYYRVPQPHIFTDRLTDSSDSCRMNGVYS